MKNKLEELIENFYLMPLQTMKEEVMVMENIIIQAYELGREEVVEMAEGMKKKAQQVSSPCPDGRSGCLVYHSEMIISQNDKIYNSALEDIIKKLKDE